MRELFLHILPFKIIKSECLFQGTYVHLGLKMARDILKAGATLNRGASQMVLLITDGDYKVNIQ